MEGRSTSSGSVEEFFSPKDLVEDDCPAHLYRLTPSPSISTLAKIVHFRNPEIKIGREQKSVDLFLDSTLQPNMISRLHAKILQDNTQWKIVDNKSMNGLFINNKRVAEAVLRDGDKIVFGGGGALPMGSIRAQSNSEFIYVFKVTARSKRSQSQMQEEEELAKKKRKLEEEEEKLRQEQERIAREKEALHLKAMKEEEDWRAAQMKAQKEKDEYEHAFRRREEELNSLKLQLSVQHGRLQAQEAKLTAQILEQEERVKARESVLSQEIRQRDEQLANERNSLQEMKRELENTRVSLESKKSLEAELARSKVVLEDLEKKHSLARTELEDEFVCTICQEVFIEAATLPCSHTFCSDCINRWLSFHVRCPLCREDVSAEPIRSRSLDNIIEKLITRLPSEDQEQYRSRKEKKQAEEVELKRLRELIEKARAKGMPFLSIFDRWKDNEKETFSTGIKKYSGKARVYYCQLTGLTPGWISHAPANALRLACENLNLRSESFDHNTTEMKRALNSFIIE
jgi:pSer/pThr/pTyr-binding forkhead associated (FHA) protein